MKKRMVPARPRSVTITTWGVFLFGLVNLWRVFALADQRELLMSLDVSLDPTIRLIAAALLALCSLGLVIGLLRRWPRTRLAIPLLLFINLLYRLVLLTLFVQSPTARRGLPGEIIWQISALVFVIWALNRSATQNYFAEQ